MKKSNKKCYFLIVLFLKKEKTSNVRGLRKKEIKKEIIPNNSSNILPFSFPKIRIKKEINKKEDNDINVALFTNSSS